MTTVRHWEFLALLNCYNLLFCEVICGWTPHKNGWTPHKNLVGSQPPNEILVCVIVCWNVRCLHTQSGLYRCIILSVCPMCIDPVPPTSFWYRYIVVVNCMLDVVIRSAALPSIFLLRCKYRWDAIDAVLFGEQVCINTLPRRVRMSHHVWDGSTPPAWNWYHTIQSYRYLWSWNIGHVDIFSKYNLCRCYSHVVSTFVCTAWLVCKATVRLSTSQRAVQFSYLTVHLHGTQSIFTKPQWITP